MTLRELINQVTVDGEDQTTLDHQIHFSNTYGWLKELRSNDVSVVEGRILLTLSDSDLAYLKDFEV